MTDRHASASPPASEPPLPVLALCGSLRRDSLNRRLLGAAIELAPASLAIRTFDGLGAIPPYDADRDLDPRPEAVVALADALRGSAGLLIVSPEYNYSVPGHLKNALDWVSRGGPASPLRRLPVALQGASAGMSGTMRMQYHLRQVFVFTDSPVLPQPEVFVTNAAERFDADGRLVHEQTREIVRRQLEAFAAWIHAVRGR